MDTASIVTLVVALVVAIFTSITAPLILAHRTDKMHREDREADYARQDALAARLVEQNKAAAEVTNGKLDTIHTLVNSNMTAAMQSELDSVRRELVLMHEIIDLKRSAGTEPTKEALRAISATRDRIDELAAALEDRQQATDRIEAKEQADDGTAP